MSRVAIVGSRDFTDYDRFKQELDRLLVTRPRLIVSGGARGPDTMAKQYATEHQIPFQELKPDWKRHGRAAGFLRNTDIVNAVDLVIVFWDGQSRGTKDTIDKAGNKVRVVRI